MEEKKFNLYPEERIKAKIINACEELKKSLKHGVGWYIPADAYNTEHWFIEVGFNKSNGSSYSTVWFQCVKREKDYYIMGLFVQPPADFINNIELIGTTYVETDNIQLEDHEKIVTRLMSLIKKHSELFEFS